MNPPVRKLRCAVYTRKSTEEGLDQEFNSLDAQRDACEAFIASQRAEGWILFPNHYDDGGVSGGTLERPALKRLLADIEEGQIDVVVVYKIDRLSRSLMDFARLVETFERNGVTFVSVTQSFNTTTSMGRLTLNVLLSFAQFEREVIGERIRDKFAASRKRGLWMGGAVPLGYRVLDRKLLIEPREATIVKRIFERFVQVGSNVDIVRELQADGVTNRRGKPLDKAFIARVLRNRVYLGEATHKGVSYPGEHEAIIESSLWEKVEKILAINPGTRSRQNSATTPSMLKGLLFGHDGRAMSPSHTRRKGKLYRYYVSQTELKLGAGSGFLCRVPAAEIEAAVVQQMRHLIQTPEVLAEAVHASQRLGLPIGEREMRSALTELDLLWDQLFPGEQARIVQLLVARVDLGADTMSIKFHANGIADLVEEMGAISSQEQKAV
ncbi:MAG: recombinase family protein [Novosphingobium sp.]|nr:recombinase family protein [Novosphingobium sp.]